MYYVYMLRCEDNSLYTGITTDVERRMKEHFSKGKKCAKYTFRHTPKKLETYFEVKTRSIALSLEYHIKTLKKEQKEQLIHNKELLKEFLGEKYETIFKEKCEKRNIKNKLKKLVDEKYREFHSNLCPGTENILGIRVPVLRKYAKELYNNYSSEELLKTIDNEFYEEIMLQGMIIGFDKKASWNEIKKRIKKFIPKIDNWAICDTFCAGLKVTKKYKKEMWEFIKEYLKSDTEFEIRFAIIMILDYYIEAEYLKQIFEIFDNINSDKYYVRMAVAWAISVCLIKFYDETVEYLYKNTKIDNWTYNKAIQKAIESYRITKAQKEELRKLKKCR